jgi:folate-binding protein YgfZ
VIEGKHGRAAPVALDVVDYASASLGLPGACPPAQGAGDAGVPWHYGDPHGEQRSLQEGAGAVDLSHRGVVQVTGPDRLGWLHTITTAHLSDLAPGACSTALVLSPHGHVEHELHLVDDGSTCSIIVEPGSLQGLQDYLDSMRFMLRVTVADVSDEWAVVGTPDTGPEPATAYWRSPAQFADPGSLDEVSAKYVPRRPSPWAVREVLVPRTSLSDYLSAHGPLAGTWAWEALRVAAGVPRVGFETDHRTIPHEVGWVPAAVHLNKGCYRGQETVARVHNLGRPPRRLVLLHLDGSDDRDAAPGDPVELDGRVVGRVTSTARHFELGPIALAVVKRSVPAEATLTAGGVAAAQELVVAA